MELLDQTTSDFVSTALNGGSFKTFALAGDASSRRYYRIVKDQTSWVLMKADPYEESKSPFLSVQSHFLRSKVRVPQVLAKNGSQGLMLLEDLGDLTLERKFTESTNQDHSMVFYQMAIEQMALIHGPCTDDKSPCTAHQIKFDTEKFLWEMNYGRENLIEGVLDFKLEGKRAADVQKIFTDICRKLDEEPKRIAHRDYHSRNLMIKLDEVCVIDFQDARLGPVQYDLVSLLRDSYTDLDDEMSDRLMNSYIDRSGLRNQAEFSQDRFREIYELQSIQRCFKACGSFASFFHQREDRRYLKYLSPTLKRVLKALHFFPDYKLFADVLVDAGAFDKAYEGL